MPGQFHTSISPGDRSDTWSVSEDFWAKVMKAATDILGRRLFEYWSTFAGNRRRLIDFRVSSQQQMTRTAATSAKTWPFRSIIIFTRWQTIRVEAEAMFRAVGGNVAREPPTRTTRVPPRDGRTRST